MVPSGMLLDGFLSSPLMLAPAMMPVNELNNTPNV